MVRGNLSSLPCAVRLPHGRVEHKEQACRFKSHVRPTELKEFAVTTNRVALGLLSVVLIAPAAAAAPLPQLSGQIYDQVRAKMIRLGYRPVPFVRTEDGCLLDKSCKRYPEILGCWPTGPAHCQLAFKSPDGTKYLVVTTRGEKVRSVYSVA